ncbi:MAG: hypothetical protein M1840_005559 [Geoglossum simile]|nr:MAG: hypothetical protein M1840_005559 [Geoglossum simile]
MPNKSSAAENNRTLAGTSVFILQRESDLNNPTFIVGERKGSHGSGTLALPGGHIDYGESPYRCAAREVREETELVMTNVRFLTFTTDCFETKQYITLFMVCMQDDNKEPIVLETDKCGGWEYMTWEDMKRNAESGDKKLFLPLLNLLKQRPDVIPNAEWLAKTPAVLEEDFDSMVNEII